MKRKTIKLLTFLCLVAAFYLWYTNPKKINETFEGVLFQLGSDNTDVNEILEIQLKGKVKRGLFGNKTFNGLIEIDGEVIPPSEAKDDEIEFEFGNGVLKGSPIRYIDVEQDHVFTYGTIYMQDDMRRFIITVIVGNSWNSGDGMVIAAPATSRAQGLKITNELFDAASFNLD